MTTIKKLEEFYYGDLKATLNSIEKERKNSINRMMKSLFKCTVIFLLIGLVVVLITGESKYLMVVFGFYCMFAQGTYGAAASDYNNNFKESIINPLVKSIDESLVYSKGEHISQEDFVKSELLKVPDSVSGDDYVSGEIEGVKIEFSDSKAQTKSIDKDKKVKYSTYFKGFFIKSSFNRSFQGKTFVLPETSLSTFGSFFGNWIQSMKTNKGELVKMDNDQFEREFVVYSSDQVEARYILTPIMMERLLDFKKKSIHPIYISFIDDCIHIIIDNNKNNFEATLFRSILDYDIAFEYILNIHLASSLINNLKLNEKLWGEK